MGITGAKVFRHRGRSFIYPAPYGGLPEGLGLAVYNLIPKDPAAFDHWVKDMRNTLDETYEHYDPDSYDESLIMARLDIFDSWDGCHPDDRLEHVYEINLDAGVFCYQFYPVFHLANMPPQNVFLRVCLGREDKGQIQGEPEDDDGEYTEFSPDLVKLRRLTPEEYQFNMTHVWAPTVNDDDISSYEPRCTGTVSMTEMQDILNLRPCLSTAEDLCLYLLRDCTVIVAQQKLKELYTKIALADVWTSVYVDRYTQEADTALFFACMTLLPFTTLCGPWFPKEQEDLETLIREEAKNKEHCWFPRRHICYTLGTHLLDDRNARYHVNRMVDHIISTATPDTPSIVYGVVFSIFHCIVLRVDVAAGGAFKRTELLDFLPPSFQHSDPWGVIAPTPGMILMTRLGHLAAADDLQFFHSNLSNRWWNAGHLRFESMSRVKKSNVAGQMRDNAAQETTSTADIYQSRGGSIPFDVFCQIAFSINNPQTLLNFAIASKATMTASIPRLRHPQFISRHPYGTWSPCFKDYFPSGVIFSSRPKDSDLFPTSFEIVHDVDEGLGFLQIMPPQEQHLITVRIGSVAPVNLCKAFPPTSNVHQNNLSSWVGVVGTDKSISYAIWPKKTTETS